MYGAASYYRHRWWHLDLITVMSNLLKRILVGVCVALVMMCVHKLSHASSGTQFLSHGHYGSTAQAACAANAQSYGAGYTGVADDSQNCMVYFPDGSLYVVSTWTTSSYSCPGVQVPNSSGVCADPPPTCTPDGIGNDPLPGSHHDILYAGRGKSAGWPKKINGCGIQVDTLDEDCKSYKTAVAGVYDWYCGYGYHYDGSGNYTPDAPGPTAPVPVVPSTDPDKSNQPMTAPSPNPDNSCPSGTSNIGTDSAGTAMCSGSGTGTSPSKNTTTTAPPVTKTNADGSTTTTNSTSGTNKDGSTTTNTTACTVATGGSQSCVTTSSTSNNADGAPGKSDGTGTGGGGTGKDDLCSKHPELNVCSNSQVTGGCSVGVDTTACSGDAIQCAILRQQKKEYCENTKPNPLADLGNQIIAGNDPMQSDINKAIAGTEVDVSSQQLDSSGFLGGGSCFGDRQFVVAGHAIPVSFAPLCNNITPLRYAILICASIAALMLVSKSIIQG